MTNKFVDMLLQTRDLKNSLYNILKHSFLYHSNKIEGSTFTTEALALLLDKNVVTGKHTLDDVQETVNSSYVFDTIIDTLGIEITESYLKNLHASLMFNTSLHAKGYAGIYKTIPNMIIGTNTRVSQPFEVQAKINELLEWYYSLNVVTIKDIAEFHYRFELIHPFQDGNGRIGRFIMLKQMLENNLPLKIVSWDTEDLYRSSLSLCSIGNYEPLISYLDSLNDFREDYSEFY
ncbi:fic family protein,Protein involved in cell division,mobile mystery protein B,Fic/DOC family [[Clostridium] sordellii]|uniref:Fic family protein n=1 Tax=Paraclostridium sordellii TaxID=1505 RepID=UPI000541BBEE|nr:Fic family protein [Paeniclostridium sordellii]CEK34612.1 fic family protein,Protein involved in cell division,mobile mystery protein B,Fic/DOC family [[Clostridium] sordellii] [Paeniclostridium sordellii]